MKWGVRPMNRNHKRKIVTYIAFVFPAVFFFSLIILLPFIRAIIYSFQDWNGISAHIKWVGIANYKELVHDKEFWDAAKFTFKFVVWCTLLSNVFGFGLALMLNKPLKTRNLLKVIFFLPYIIASILAGFIWNFIFSQVLPHIGEVLHISILQTNWLSSPNYAFWSLALVFLWQFSGYLMIIYYAGLQGVPADLVEAAEIDGANRWSAFRFIVLPLMRPAFTICLFLALSSCFKVFDLTLSLTKGGPFGSTQSLAYHIYHEAFERNNYTLASAKAVIFFLILSVITVMQVGFMKRREVEM
jgi:raffinose/stachyose/melibiose transport system permease protein